MISLLMVSPLCRPLHYSRRAELHLKPTDLAKMRPEGETWTSFKRRLGTLPTGPHRSRTRFEGAAVAQIAPGGEHGRGIVPAAAKAGLNYPLRRRPCAPNTPKTRCGTQSE